VNSTILGGMIQNKEIIFYMSVKTQKIREEAGLALEMMVVYYIILIMKQLIVAGIIIKEWHIDVGETQKEWQIVR
jgi:threonine/homoserine/homoserine lactone efflux protein